jgi:hypothetical protein
MNILTLRNHNTIALQKAENGQTIKTFSVDGDIVSGPNIAGTTGYATVKKNNSLKNYIYDLERGVVVKILSA